MQPFHTILFDLDDTLIHFDDYWNDSLLATFSRHSCTKDLEQKRLFDIFMEMNARFEAEYDRQQISLREFRNLRLIHALDKYDILIDTDTADDFNKMLMDISREYMKASPELVRFLTQLSERYTLGIVTNGTRNWQLDKVEALGLRQLFADEAIIVSEDVGCEKPSPDLYAYALARFRAEPSQVLFVGDSWKNDVEGPIRYGMNAVWLNRKGAAVPGEPKPLGIVNDLFELTSYL